MFVDARSLPSNTVIRTTVCVIGGGAAGITLARGLSRRGIPVCLLESGGLTPDAATQALYEGEHSGKPYRPLDQARLRFFGGTTNHWAGYCRPLDELDFEPQPWIPHSGWPFRRSELDGYYQAAHEICDLGPYSYDSNAWDQRSPGEPIPVDTGRVVQRITQFSTPTRFGIKFRDEIRTADSIVTYLYANLVRLETNAVRRQIVRAHAATLTGVTFAVEARVYVLACGGIENARLLLVSNLGNDHDLVGRFFMDHTNTRCAKLLLRPEAVAQMAFYETHDASGWPIQGCLGLAPDVRRREQVANVTAWLEPLPAGRPGTRGIRSLRYLKGEMQEGRLPDNLGFHVQNILQDPRKTAKDVFEWMFKETAFRIRTTAELVPNPGSRVTLSREKDPLGMNRCHLDLRPTALDKRSLFTTVSLIARELGRLDLARARVEISDDVDMWPDNVGWGSHHIGTTRMHDDPRHGVVDRHCRLHAVGNLFVAGSSVFPTSGSAQPTLTIVALALRLADYVDRELEQ